MCAAAEVTHSYFGALQRDVARRSLLDPYIKSRQSGYKELDSHRLAN